MNAAQAIDRSAPGAARRHTSDLHVDTATPVLPTVRAPDLLPCAAALQRIGRAATVALYDELALAPKPGLVSFADSGSHTDMDARTFLRSLFALRHYFVQIATLGWQQAPFAALEAAGIAAEARMLAATGGINTHRGAVFTLGLLCASAGAALRAGEAVQNSDDAGDIGDIGDMGDRVAAPKTLTDAGAAVADGLASARSGLSPVRLRAHLHQHWGAARAARSQRATGLPGSIAAQRHGLRSAGQEAAAGFPTLFTRVVPALAAGLRRGLPPAQARLDALFQAMAALDDTNLVHRGGMAGLRHAQRSAQQFLDAGGAAAPGAMQAAWALHHDFVARRLSPGGAADTLAAACWVVRVCGAG